MDENMITRRHQEMIWAYVTGKLTCKEIDQVWVEILKYPKLLEYLRIEAGLYIILSKSHKQNFRPFSK